MSEVVEIMKMKWGLLEKELDKELFAQLSESLLGLYELNSLTVAAFLSVASKNLLAGELPEPCPFDEKSPEIYAKQQLVVLAVRDALTSLGPLHGVPLVEPVLHTLLKLPMGSTFEVHDLFRLGEHGQLDDRV